MAGELNPGNAVGKQEVDLACRKIRKELYDRVHELINEPGLKLSGDAKVSMLYDLVEAIDKVMLKYSDHVIPPKESQ